MFIFIIYFFVALNIFSLYMLFGLNYVKIQTTGHAMIPVFIDTYGYSNASYYLSVSPEKEKNFVKRHYKFDVKVIERYADDTVKIKLMRSYVDNTDMRKFENEYTILKSKDINMKV